MQVEVGVNPAYNTGGVNPQSRGIGQGRPVSGFKTTTASVAGDEDAPTHAGCTVARHNSSVRHWPVRCSFEFELELDRPDCTQWSHVCSP